MSFRVEITETAYRLALIGVLAGVGEWWRRRSAVA